MYKICIFIFFFSCIVLCSCGQRHRTAIGNGYYYASGERTNIDKLASVDLEYSKDGSGFITIHKALHGGSDALLFGNLVIFRTAGGGGIRGASPSGKSFDIIPLARNRWERMDISKTAKWDEANGDYHLAEVKNSEQGLIVKLFVSNLGSSFPAFAEILIPWNEIKSLAE